MNETENTTMRVWVQGTIGQVQPVLPDMQGLYRGSGGGIRPHNRGAS